jgi:hypothetical protein
MMGQGCVEDSGLRKAGFEGSCGVKDLKVLAKPSNILVSSISMI